MPEGATNQLLANPRWRLDVHGEQLVVSAGADEVYVVDEAFAGAIPHILTAYQSNQCANLLDDAQCGAAIRQLRRLGALVPAPAHSATVHKRASVQWLGAPWPALTDALTAHGWLLVQDAPDVALLLIVRTNASWTEALAQYQQTPPDKVHVLIDLAYHHTVCLGPLVVPGQTACIACLGHRLMRRWGDLLPPAQPASLQRAAGVAALLADASVLGSSLVERSVALDIAQLKMHTSTVFPMPGCPVCATAQTAFALGASAVQGRLELPWLR